MFPALTLSLLNECKTNPWTGVDSETIWQEWTLDVGNGEWVLGQITKSHITHRVHLLITSTFVFTFCWAPSKQNVLLDWDGTSCSAFWLSYSCKHKCCSNTVFTIITVYCIPAYIIIVHANHYVAIALIQYFVYGWCWFRYSLLNSSNKCVVISVIMLNIILQSLCIV